MTVRKFVCLQEISVDNDSFLRLAVSGVEYEFRLSAKNEHGFGEEATASFKTPDGGEVIYIHSFVIISTFIRFPLHATFICAFLDQTVRSSKFNFPSFFSYFLFFLFLGFCLFKLDNFICFF